MTKLTNSALLMAHSPYSRQRKTTITDQLSTSVIDRSKSRSISPIAQTINTSCSPKPAQTQRRAGLANRRSNMNPI
jgi:hypothetical protein